MSDSSDNSKTKYDRHLDKAIYLKTLKMYIDGVSYGELFNQVCVDDTIPITKLKELVSAHLFYLTVSKTNDKELIMLSQILGRLELIDVIPTKHYLLYCIYYLSNIDVKNLEEKKMLNHLYS